MREGLRKEIGGRSRARGVTNSWRKRLSMRQVVAGGLEHARACRAGCAESLRSDGFLLKMLVFLLRSIRYNPYH
jgi:hypothetical protein